MKYSIVVATYNRKEALKRCVKSVLAQTYDDFELLVIDDGSTDGTGEMMGSFEDIRVRYLSLDKNYGTATPARNLGIEEMTGDALIIWDSDDVLLPHALQIIENGFQLHKEVGIVCTSTDFYLGVSLEKYNRPSSFLLTAEDMISGKKPKDAEIIAVRKRIIGSVRFESRGIDFMFYAKIVGQSNTSTYYINKTCGVINLESDDLSLTLARKKRNKKLSMERAPILENFVINYQKYFIGVNGKNRLAGHAFGASLGFILAGQFDKARELLKFALKRRKNFLWSFILLVLYIPFGGKLIKMSLR